MKDFDQAFSTFQLSKTNSCGTALVNVASVELRMTFANVFLSDI